MRRVIYVIIILIFLLAIYGLYFNIYGIKINEYHIQSDTIGSHFSELKFVHFSDLLYKSSTDSKALKKLVNKINEQETDVIFFTGDLFSKKPSEEDIKELTNSLKSLKATQYKYAVIGDHDAKYLDQYKVILENSGFILLDNKATLLFYKDLDPINIIGLTDINNIDQLLTTEIPVTYNIVLTHMPDNYSELNNKNINLVLAGHTLNGQVRIPFYGGIIKKEGGKNFLNHHYNQNDTEMYISNGLGCEYYNIRLFNKPSINVYRFN